MGLPDPQCAAEPRIMGVPVVVLCRTERVRHALKAIQYGARKVIGGIHPEIEEVGGVLREREYKMSINHKDKILQSFNTSNRVLAKTFFKEGVVLRSKHICVFSGHIKDILPQKGGTPTLLSRFS